MLFCTVLLSFSLGYWMLVIRPFLSMGHGDMLNQNGLNSAQSLCVLGDQKSRTQKLEHVLAQLRIAGYDLDVSIAAEALDCPETADAILRLHSALDRTNLPFEDDVSKVMSPPVAKALKKLDHIPNIRGFFMRAQEPDQSPKTYISVNLMHAPELAYLADRFEHLLMEELYQALSGAVDLSVTRAPRSVLEEKITPAARRDFTASGASSGAEFHDSLAISGQGLKYSALSGRFGFRDLAASAWITSPFVRSLPVFLEGVAGVPLASYRYLLLNLCRRNNGSC